MFRLEVRGLEPLTYGLQSHRSSQLSYTPGVADVKKPSTRQFRPRHVTLVGQLVVLNSQ